MKRKIQNQPLLFTHVGIEIITCLEDCDISHKDITYADIATRIVKIVNRYVELNGLKGFPLTIENSVENKHCATARATLARMPIIDDPIISDALRDVGL